MEPNFPAHHRTTIGPVLTGFANHSKATCRAGISNNTIAPIKAMSGLSDRDKDKILGGNAMKLFGMKTVH